MCVCVCVCVCVRMCICVCILATNIVFLFLFRPNWPPLEFSKRATHDERYNILHYMNDLKGNFQMFCWIDNNIVRMVSNVHIGTKDKSVMKPRKKPRINELNRKHIRLV